MRVLKTDDGEVCDLAFSPDGRTLAVAVADRGVFLCNLEAPTPTPVRLSAAGGFCKGGLHFSADGRTLAWRFSGGQRIYDREAREYTDHSFAVTKITHGIAVSADGSRAISQHGLPDFCLMGWRPGDDEWIRCWTISTAELSVESISLSGDGRQFAMLTRPALGERWWQGARQIEVRDAATSTLRGVGEYPYNYAEPLWFSPDGRQLVGFNDMTLLVWPVPEIGPLGSPRLIRNDNRKQFTSLAYHPSGRYLYATNNDTTVQLFDTATWERAGRFTWQVGPLKAVAVSPDGMLAAAGGDKGTVVIWDLDG